MADWRGALKTAGLSVAPGPEMNASFPHQRRGLLAAIGLSVLSSWCARAAAAARTDEAMGPQGGPPALLLATEAPADVDPDGFLVSEKYDGVRAFWDGRRLRTRGGNGIAAPGWFTQGLPREALDGELWAGRGRFQALSGAVRRGTPRDEEWQRITYMAFDLPGAPGPFSARAERLATLGQAIDRPGFQAVEQRRVHSRAALQRWLDEVLAGGGEGLMLHRADALATTGRSPVLQKLKREHDAEARVLGSVPGRGRHLGRMGALRVVTPGGQVFLLGTGFSDAEREAPPAPGSIVSYRHRGHTEAGLPRFATFLRVHHPAPGPARAVHSLSEGESQRGSGP
jgi:DNA ligase-1